MAQASDVVATGYPAGAALPAGAPGLRLSWHDIPHPIGDPDDDEGLPGDDEDDEDEEDDDDEDPLQL